MSDTNKDGLVPGQEIDFYTLQKVKREQAQRLKDGRATSKKPAAKGKGKGSTVKPVPESNGSTEQSSISGVLRSDAE